MGGRIRLRLRKLGQGAVVLFALSVVVFDLVFSWFGPPADAWLAAIWFFYILPGNLVVLLGALYVTGYLGPFHVRRRPKKADSP